VTRYWKFVVPAALLAGVLVVVVFMLNSNLVYFNTPTELQDESAGEQRHRLGGQVVAGSVAAGDQGVSFEVTDGRVTLPVAHQGAPPQLFQEGVGVVVEGTWDGTTFHSDTMLVKHDEQYRSEDGVYDPEHPSGET
jgi:cytochrome c-type biogenesis protein CcmE